MTKKKEVALKIEVNEDGQVISVKNKDGKELTDSDYSKDEKRRIDDVGVLATNNWCCWVKIDGVWHCIPC